MTKTFFYTSSIVTIVLLSIFILGINSSITAQSSDIHSAQVIKLKKKINTTADSLSGIRYNLALSYCLNEIDIIQYSDKPDLYSDLLCKAGKAAYQIGEVAFADSLMENLINLQIRNIHPVLQAHILYNKFRASMHFGRKINAIRYGKEALIIFNRHKNVEEMINMNKSIGNTYYLMGRYDQSLIYMDESIEIAKEAKRNKDYCMSLLRSIQTLMKKNDIDEINKRLEIVKRISIQLKDEKLKAEYAYENGRFLYNQENYILAEKSFANAVQYYISVNHHMRAANFITWQAAVAIMYKNYKEAIRYNQKASFYRLQAKSSFLSASSQYNIANSMIYLHMYDSALYYINRGEEIYKPYASRPDYVRGMDLKRKIYLQRNQHELAFKTLERKIIVQDSLQQIQNERKVKELESDFEMNKFEKIKEGMIVESQIQKMENKRSQLFLNIIAVILLLVFVFSVLIYLHISSKNKRDVALANQKLIFIQMNSHFVFNAFTAIQSLIYKKQLESAIHYLTVFSSLINKITGETQKKYISLQIEVGFIIEFLQIQKLRFGDILRYQINIEDGLDLQKINVPPMLTYPFIEYAVEECVQKASKKGEIIINISEDGKHLKYELIDKNLGFINLKECFIKRYGGQELLCNELTSERISIYNHILNPRIIFAEKIVVIDNQEYNAIHFLIKI